MAIFWSAPTRVYSLDVDYEYRQDSNLLYLTGLDQPDTILVLMPGNGPSAKILFVREADARREHWNGHSLTPAEASEQTGIETVLTGNQFEPFVAGMLSGQGGSTVSIDEGHAFFEALGQGHARLALLLEPQRNSDRSRRDRRGVCRAHARPILRLRGQGRHARSSAIAPPNQDAVRTGPSCGRAWRSRADAHKAGMRTAAPGKWEYEVEAAIEEVYLRNGAMSWGYPSIVGSGPNATILHYQRSVAADAGRRAPAGGRRRELPGADRSTSRAPIRSAAASRRRSATSTRSSGGAGGGHRGGQGRATAPATSRRRATKCSGRAW